MHRVPARFRAYAFVVANLAIAWLGPAPAAGQGAFYQASEREIAGPVGSIIREEPRVGAAAGATAYKVLSFDRAGRHAHCGIRHRHHSGR